MEIILPTYSELSVPNKEWTIFEIMSDSKNTNTNLFLI